MTNVLSFLLILGFFAEFLHGQEQFHRAVVRPRKRIKRVRLHRQIFEEPSAHRYAAEAVQDALQNEQGSQLLVQHLASQFHRSSQTQEQPNPPTVQKDASELAQNRLVFVDQYGRLVSENPTAQAGQHVFTSNSKNVHLEGLSQPQAHSQHQNQPRLEVYSQFQPSMRSHVMQQEPTPQIRYVNQFGTESESSNPPQQVAGEQYAFPALQHVLSPQDLVLQHEPLLVHQGIHGALPVFRHPLQLPAGFPQHVIQPQYTGQLQVIPQPEQAHYLQPQIAYHLDPAPLPVVPLAKKIVAPPAVVKKTVVPAAVVKVVPEVHLIKQPVLPPAVFQKQIFALKNPPVRVLTYSDLCTVYPYQRKLAGCVLKKSAIPELHHPDIQQVSSATNVAETEAKNNPDEHSTAGGMENIQAILGPPQKGDTGSILPLDEEGVESSAIQSDVSEEAKNDSVNVAAPSNKNVNRIVVGSKVSKALVAAKTTSVPVTTPSTTVDTRGAETTTTRKPKTKGRSSRNGGGSKRTTSSGGRRKGRTESRKSRSTSTTTETPFKLA